MNLLLRDLEFFLLLFLLPPSPFIVTLTQGIQRIFWIPVTDIFLLLP